MDNAIASEVQPTSLLEHPAVIAWQQLGGKRLMPQRVETIKLKKKSASYRLIGASSNGTAVVAKRCAAATGFLERLVYEEILAYVPSPALRCHGFAPEPETDSCWLFLDDAGAEQYSPTCAQHRALAGHCLGIVQKAARDAEAQTWLPERGPRYYLGLLQSSRSSLLHQLHNPELSNEETVLLYDLVTQFNLMEEHWEELEYFCARQPHTLVHGDFAAKNLRIQNGAERPALLAFDWEMAGWGVPAADLAQYVGSSASPDLAAYCSVMRDDFPELNRGDVQRTADYGTMLRLLDKIYWMTTGLVKDSRAYLAKPLRSFVTYHQELVEALRTLAWSAHD